MTFRFWIFSVSKLDNFFDNFGFSIEKSLVSKKVSDSVLFRFWALSHTDPLWMIWLWLSWQHWQWWWWCYGDDHDDGGTWQWPCRFILGWKYNLNRKSYLPTVKYNRICYRANCFITGNFDKTEIVKSKTWIYFLAACNEITFGYSISEQLTERYLWSWQRQLLCKHLNLISDQSNNKHDLAIALSYHP